MAAADFFGARRAAGNIDWPRTALLAEGLILGSAVLDRRAFNFADRHKDSRLVKDGVRLGNALPVAALALSGLFAFDDSRPRLADAGIAALEAGPRSIAGGAGRNYAGVRAPPTPGLG